MGWWSNIKGWGMQGVKGIGRFAFDTTLYMIELLAVAPLKAGNKIIDHDKTRRLASHVGRVAMTDILPLVAFGYFTGYVVELLERQVQYLEEENQEQSLVNAYLVLQTSIAVVRAINIIYQTRMGIRSVIHLAALNLESPSAFAQINDNNNKRTVCEEQECNFQRRLLGAVRNEFSYYSTEIALAVLRQAPGGSVIAPIVKVYHRGGYVISIIFVPLCNRHQVTYRIENPALVVALGLTQALLSALVSYAIEFTTGVPATFYASYVDQITMLISIGNATQLPLPFPVAESKKPIVDPAVALQYVLGVSFDTVAKGIKAQIPQIVKILKIFFKQPPSDIPWGAIFSLLERIWGHPFARQIEAICLPYLVRSVDGFKKDPIIEPNWEEYRLALIWVIEIIKQVSNDYSLVINLAKRDPKLAADALSRLFGLNKPLTELLINLIGNPDFMERLREFGHQLEAMPAGDASSITPNPDSTPLRNPSIMGLEITEVEELVIENPGLPASEVISPLPSQEFSTFPSPSEVIGGHSKLTFFAPVGPDEESRALVVIPDDAPKLPSKKKQSSKKSVYTSSDVIFRPLAQKSAGISERDVFNFNIGGNSYRSSSSIIN